MGRRGPAPPASAAARLRVVACAGLGEGPPALAVLGGRGRPRCPVGASWRPSFSAAAVWRAGPPASRVVRAAAEVGAGSRGRRPPSVFVGRGPRAGRLADRDRRLALGRLRRGRGYGPRWRGGGRPAWVARTGETGRRPHGAHPQVAVQIRGLDASRPTGLATGVTQRPPESEPLPWRVERRGSRLGCGYGVELVPSELMKKSVRVCWVRSSPAAVRQPRGQRSGGCVGQPRRTCCWRFVASHVARGAACCSDAGRAWSEMWLRRLAPGAWSPCLLDCCTSLVIGFLRGGAEEWGGGRCEGLVARFSRKPCVGSLEGRAGPSPVPRTASQSGLWEVSTPEAVGLPPFFPMRLF